MIDARACFKKDLIGQAANASELPASRTLIQELTEWSHSDGPISEVSSANTEIDVATTTHASIVLVRNPSLSRHLRQAQDFGTFGGAK